MIENYRNAQKKDQDDSQPVGAYPAQVPHGSTQNGQVNKDPNPETSETTEITAQQDSTDSSASSEDETQKKKKAKRNRKRNTFKLSNKRAALKLQLNDEQVKLLPKPKEATNEQIEEIRQKYDLPLFPSRKNMGHSTVFTDVEEKQMLNYLKEMSTQGYPRTIYQFQSELQYYYQTQCTDKNKKGYVFGMYSLVIITLFLLLIIKVL